MSCGAETDPSRLGEQLVAEFRATGYASSAFTTDSLAEGVASFASRQLAGTGVLVTRIGSKISIGGEP